MKVEGEVERDEGERRDDLGVIGNVVGREENGGGKVMDIVVNVGEGMGGDCEGGGGGGGDFGGLE